MAAARRESVAEGMISHGNVDGLFLIAAVWFDWAAENEE